MPLAESSTGTDTFTWSNGRTSVMTYEDQTIGAIAVTTGVFISGQFTGMRATWVGTSAPFAEPVPSLTGMVEACGLGRRVVTPFGYAGAVSFYYP